MNFHANQVHNGSFLDKLEHWEAVAQSGIQKITLKALVCCLQRDLLTFLFMLNSLLLPSILQSSE